MKRVNRRGFLRAVGIGFGTFTAATYWTPNICAGDQQTIRVRKEVNSLSPTELNDLKSVVRILKKRTEANANDTKGWRGQATIHNDFCPHSNWFFLPWHRAYLDQFEQICRDALGPGSTFSLPYWDWTKNPYLPASFWGQDNPLFDASRDIDPNEAIPPEMTGEKVLNNILDIQDFETFASGKSKAQRPTSAPKGFTGQLEGVPHNNVHGEVGGDMGAYMSPLDPIFWLHHANIDRLWNEWVRRHQAGTTKDSDWLDFQVGTFVDLQGNPVKRKVSDLLDTRTLGYRYDTDPESPPKMAFSAPPRVLTEFMARSTPTAAATIVNPLSTSVGLSPELSNLVNESAKSDVRGKTIRLTIGDIPIPENTKFKVRVFLNCKQPNARTPVGDPSYVGSFCFFTHSHDSAGGNHQEMHAEANKPQTAAFCFDVSDVVRRLELAGEYKAQSDITVSLVPVPLKRGEAVIGEIKPGLIEFTGLK